MHDTPEEILQMQREIIAAKTPEERFSLGIELITFGRMVVENSIRAVEPDITEIDLRTEDFRRCYQDQFKPEEMSVILHQMRMYLQEQTDLR
jgi:hypothetical protein